MRETFWQRHDRIMYRITWAGAAIGVGVSAYGIDLPHVTQITAFFALMLAASARCDQTD